MTTALRNAITELASTFASSVLNAIRGASLEEILSETSGGASVRRGPGRPRSVAAPVAAAAVDMGTPMKRGPRARGRLERRSAGDISQIVDRIVSLLESSPTGLRAEQIREELGLEAKELPRPIADALASKRIVKNGQKRATTYFAKGAGKGGAKAAGGGKRGAPKKAARGNGKKAPGRRGRPAASESSSNNDSANS